MDLFRRLYTNKMLFVFILIGTLGLLFYWLYLRPELIRKDCYTIAINAKLSPEALEIRNIIEASRGEPFSESAPASKKEQNNIYRSCLVKNGLKPESLFVNLK